MPTLPEQALESRTFVRTAVAGCPRCSGVWVSRDALRALLGGASPGVAATKGTWWQHLFTLLTGGLPG